MAAACLVRAAALGTRGMLAAGRAALPVMYLVFLLTGAAGVVYENAATAIVRGPWVPFLLDTAGLRGHGRHQPAELRCGRRP